MVSSKIKFSIKSSLSSQYLCTVSVCIRAVVHNSFEVVLKKTAALVQSKEARVLWRSQGPTLLIPEAQRLRPIPSPRFLNFCCVKASLRLDEERC
jgi:hypothetical protein